MSDIIGRPGQVNRRHFLRRSGALGLGLSLGLDTLIATAEIPQSALKDLRESLGENAKLLTPSDDNFKTTGLPMNGRYAAVRPGAIVQCANENDVAVCVKWCKKNSISPVVRGGGHSYAGFSTTKGLLIDISRLNSVEIKEDGTAIIGGAASNANIYAKTNGGKFFLPGGTCPGVCVGGLVLGGGIGYNTRWAGLTCDGLVSTRIVLASGDVVEASAEKNSDLFWACRGAAGGSFGINTSFTFKLTAVPTYPITFFEVRWRGDQNAIKAFMGFNKVMANAELTAINANTMAQALPIDGGSANEAIAVRTRGQYLGAPGRLANELLVNLPRPAKMEDSEITEMSFWEAAAKFINDPAKIHSFGDISRYSAKPVSEEAITNQVKVLVDCPSRTSEANGSMWSLGWVGGKVVDKFARTDTAYVHRKMSTLLRPTCQWPDDAQESVGTALLDWTDKMIEQIAKETPDESYQNFPNRRIKNWQQQYYAENLKRLVEIKARYDQDNLFNNEQSIPTSLG
jgi:FAD/FMN-containing dehydrogenase